MPTDDAPAPSTWPAILDIVRDHVDERSFDLWLRTTRLLTLEGDVLVVGTNGEFQRNWIAQDHLEELEEAAREVLGRPVRIHLTVSSEPVAVPAGEAEDGEPPVEMADGSGAEPDLAPPSGAEAAAPGDGPHLNPLYTFDQFVVGPTNRLPHAACLAAAESPGRAYNPIFLHGAVGLGKTHLLHATCHTILERTPDTTIEILSCESFTNGFIRAIEQNALGTFRDRFRQVDVLAIDDIHFLGGKERTQEEFFHTFNALYNSHRQIVLSSDSSPKDIQGIEDRLTSRFKWGLVAELEPPNYETRVAILKKKARLQSVDLPDEVTHFLAEHCQKNIRELEGAITTLIGYARLDGRAIDLDLAKEAFDSTLSAQEERPVEMSDIKEEVVRHFAIRMQDFTSDKRTRSVAWPRQVAMFLAHDLLSMSLEEIGSHFGGRHHTTVLYAVNRVTEKAEEDEEVERVIENLTRAVRERRASR